MFRIEQIAPSVYRRVWYNGTVASQNLERWDGKRGTEYPYNVRDSRTAYYIAPDNTVYYSDVDGNNAGIWCSGSRLNAHCQHLNAVLARR